MYNKLEVFTEEISIRIKSLDELLMYYDIYKVFNSTLVDYSYKSLAPETVEISDILTNTLSDIFNNIKQENIKQKMDNLTNNFMVILMN